MKITKLLYIVFLLAFVGQNIYAQDNLYTIQQGSTLPFNLTISGNQLLVKLNPDNGTVELTNNGNEYVGVYTPDSDFVGYVQFKLQEITISPYSYKDYTFNVNVVESIVDTEDDFIRLTSGQLVTLDPLSNDASTASDLNLDIAHVMFGTAEVNEDNTIDYTPSDSDLDYIVYVGTDMYGTSSSSTIYIVQEGEQPINNTEDEFSVPSGKSQNIILPWTDYTLTSSDLENGTTEAINNYVYKYIANDGADGADELVFVNEAGLTHTVEIDVVERYVDGGFVRDDVFHSAKNTQLVFNVKDNDINGQTVMEDYSDELYHLGDGEFSFTPPTGEVGVYEFYYVANTGSEMEEGTIEIVVGNISPSADANYTLTTPKNKPRVIEYDVPLNTEFFEIEAYPSHGTIEVFGADESVDLGCESEIQKVFAVYTPNDDFVGADDITLRYFASGNNLPTYSTIVIITEDTDLDECICVDDCVWPGDANGDGNVNVRDVLSIGRYIGSIGETRDESPYGDTYKGVKVSKWNEDQLNGKSVGHADANGDGMISFGDIDSVVENYNDVNTLVSTDLFGVKNVPFNFLSGGDAEVGEVKEIFISLGSQEYPAIDMSGIAFSINLPAGNVDTESIELEFLEDNFFVKGAPYASLAHVSDEVVVDAAGVKTNGASSTGNGVIAVLSFIVIEDAEGIRPEGRNSTNSANTMTIDVSDIIFEDGSGRQYSVPGTSIDLKIKGDNELPTYDFTAYPNPALTHVDVISRSNDNIQDIQINSITGELITTYMNIEQPSKSIDISALDKGMYIFNVTSENKTESIKVIKG